MTFKQAQKLKKGDKVIFRKDTIKPIYEVESTSYFRDWRGKGEYIYVRCTNGSKISHKDLVLVTEA